MKTITSTAIVAIMTAVMGISAAAPAMAQPNNPGSANPAERSFRPHQPGLHQQGPRGGDVLDLSRGAEAVEIALVRLSHRITLTDAQQSLFDAMRTDAIAAATDLAAIYEGLRPAAPADGVEPTVPSFTTRLENRIALQGAQLAALEAIQPSASAFFDSLTDEQLAELTPRRPERPQGFQDRGPGQDRGGTGSKFGPGGYNQRHIAPPSPTQPATPPANG